MLVCLQTSLDECLCLEVELSVTAFRKKPVYDVFQAREPAYHLQLEMLFFCGGD